jgi:hypothetical protein
MILYINFVGIFGYICLIYLSLSKILFKNMNDYDIATNSTYIVAAGLLAIYFFKQSLTSYMNNTCQQTMKDFGHSLYVIYILFALLPGTTNIIDYYDIFGIAGHAILVYDSKYHTLGLGFISLYFSFGAINSYMNNNMLQLVGRTALAIHKSSLFYNSINKNSNNTANIYIIYYIYISSQYPRWKIILEGQMNDLKKSNILEDNKLYIVMCCNENENSKIAINMINSIMGNYKNNINYTIEKENLFEYYGIKKVYDLACMNKDKIFIYFHSKGMVYYDTSDRLPNEVKLTHFLFKNWKNTLHIFNRCNYINKAGIYPSNDRGFIWYNFWWSRGSYISNLINPIISDDRYYYETWLGLGGDNDDSYSTLYNKNIKFTQEEAIVGLDNLYI